MTTTVRKLPPAELRDGLQELLNLASELEAIEDQLGRKAMELDQGDWLDRFQGQRFVDGVAGQVRGAISDAIGDEGERPARFGPAELRKSLRDAIELVDLAIERSDDAAEPARESCAERRARANAEFAELWALLAGMRARRGLAPDNESWDGFLQAHPELDDLTEASDAS